MSTGCFRKSAKSCFLKVRRYMTRRPFLWNNRATVDASLEQPRNRRRLALPSEEGGEDRS
jgi:hypothetical protein